MSQREGLKKPFEELNGTRQNSQAPVKNRYFDGFASKIRKGVMSNHLSQTQCLAPPQLPTFGAVTPLSFQQQCYISTSSMMQPNTTYPSLNTTSPSTDSLFSVSTSLNSIPSECPPRRSDLDLKIDSPNGDDNDDFFDLEKHQKARSASFGGMTQYGSQLAMARQGLFAPSLDTIGSVASGLYDSGENLNGRLGATSVASSGLLHSPDGNNTFSPSSCNMSSPVMNDQIAQNGGNDGSDGVAGAGAKKSTTRRNAWGNLSYADLITQAIMQSPEKRLTLSQVYEWMVQNVPYFRDKGDSNSSAGWKNSIRHNLSLHSRFMRIQNEGAGKSSWWVINPDAKPGRNPRRVRASTMDTTSKATLSKKLKGARKRIHDIRAVGGLHSGVSSLAGSQTSIMSHDIYGDDEAMQGSFEPMFRPRTQSNLSVPGSSTRVSPSMEHPFDDFEFPSWVNDATAATAAAANAAANNHSGNGPIPTDILDRTDQMRIDSCRMMNGVKQEPKSVKTEPSVGPPPSYLELSSVRNQSQLQNPLLRTQLASVKFPSAGLPLPYQTYSPWPTHTSLLPPSSCAAVAQANSVSAAAALPSDLESLTLPDQPLMDFEVESLLRHELSQTTDHRLNFDNL
ncbi:unnamed protein product [Cylicocyclus nassatus]|uniref:Forkhead box protein O n=1 Tax=Cylicocyclus nassatus TaxID=53992 RepID=A0AA36M0V9_CYLNA|nr:unnamed protein product [Cylicocyclus nassatus]